METLVDNKNTPSIKGENDLKPNKKPKKLNIIDKKKKSKIKLEFQKIFKVFKDLEDRKKSPDKKSR